MRTLLVACIALGAAFCYAASNVLEQRKAADAPPESSMKIALLWHLAHQPMWWVGIAVDLGGFGLQALALGLGSLIFVQPILVTSLLFSLGLGALAGSHRLSRNEVQWAVVLMLSLVAFLLVASADGGYDQRPFRQWIVPLATIGGVVALLAVLGQRSSGAHRSALLGAAAGITFGVSSTLMKSFAHLLGVHGVVAVLTHWEPYALGVVVATGFLLVQSAFQAGDLRASLPALEVAEPVVASVLGVVLMHEHIDVDSVLEVVALAAALALMLWSAVILARFAAGSQASSECPGPAVS